VIVDIAAVVNTPSLFYSLVHLRYWRPVGEYLPNVLICPLVSVLYGQGYLLSIYHRACDLAGAVDALLFYWLVTNDSRYSPYRTALALDTQFTYGDSIPVHTRTTRWWHRTNTRCRVRVHESFYNLDSLHA
jgi:hypothetical protein